jgi:hypothetical protein
MSWHQEFESGRPALQPLAANRVLFRMFHRRFRRGTEQPPARRELIPRKSRLRQNVAWWENVPARHFVSARDISILIET